MGSLQPSNNIPTFTLSDGRQIPKIAWGSGSSGFSPEAKELAYSVGSVVLKTGLRHLDTAEGYGCEVQIGRAFKESGLERSQVFITTKISQPDCDLTLGSRSLESIRPSVLKSIANLGTQPDLLLIHNPQVAAPGELGAIWKVLENMKASGELTASIGVSNFRPQDVQELMQTAKITPVINQFEFHPFVLSQLGPLLETHKALGITTAAYGPLTPMLRHPSKGGPLKPILERIATRLGDGLDSSSVLLLWTAAIGVPVITTSTKEDRIKGFARVQDMLANDPLGGLTQEEVDEITTIGKSIHFRNYVEHMFNDYPAPNLPLDY
ncbi:Aldo/keto reductase [Meredithblackwellia eburnea MCA 4105]